MTARAERETAGRPGGHAILGADAVVSAVEGWVLHRGYPWAPWLVVGATGAFLPFELVELIHRPRAGALAMLLANTAIVAYLVRHAVASTTARPNTRTGRA